MKLIMKVMMKTTQKFKILTALTLAGSLFLAGCSTMNDSVNTVGKSVVWVAEGATKLATDVSVEKIDDKHYVLQQTLAQPIKSLDSWAMRIQAREVCPEGYIYENRNAVKLGAFAQSDNECVGGQNCGYELKWRIKCQKVPKEPFSLFGKT